MDEIAYNTADLDDALEADLLDVELLAKEAPFFCAAFGDVRKTYPNANVSSQFNEALKRVLNSLVSDLISVTGSNVRSNNVQSVGDVRNAPTRLAQLSPEAAADNASLKRFLFTYIYEHPSITEDRDRSVQCLEELFLFYLKQEGSMPPAHEQLALASPRHVVVCDYIAGMTDQFLLRQHRENVA
ncbi:MAG: hypothetical protein NVS9B14_08050 [Candidatus Acidiferrum sp.]